MQKQIDALKELCMKAGVSDDDIQACTPRSEYRSKNEFHCADNRMAIQHSGFGNLTVGIV